MPAERRTHDARGASAARLPDHSSVLDELMTADEVAEILKLRTSTVEDYARRRVLPSVKLGRHRRFIRSQVERAVAELANSN